MPTPKNPHGHLLDLLENLAEVQQLLSIHEGIAGTGRGRKYDVEVLNKSAIVLVVACWEAFVEDIVKSSLEHFIDHAKDHSAFPATVLERVASKHSGLKAWDLAGNGWKKSLRDNLSEVLAKTTGTFNTPKATHVDELFTKALGVPKISSFWAWPGRSSTEAAKALDALVTLRGSIAHRVKHSRSVLKKDVVGAIDLISRLSAKTNNNLGVFLKAKTTIEPWKPVAYKGMR